VLMIEEFNDLVSKGPYRERIVSCYRYCKCSGGHDCCVIRAEYCPDESYRKLRVRSTEAAHFDDNFNRECPVCHENLSAFESMSEGKLEMRCSNCRSHLYELKTGCPFDKQER
jgi:hypothetical protein